MAYQHFVNRFMNTEDHGAQIAEKAPTECPYPGQNIPEIRPKPCPCCGGTAYALQSEIGVDGQWIREGADFWVECADCGLQTAMHGDIQTALRIWERRKNL